MRNIRYVCTRKERQVERENEIRENLQDAGCSEVIIEDFMNCCRKGQIGRGMKMLAKCRQELLEDIHEGQRKIDCLDYLEYRIRKEEETCR